MSVVQRDRNKVPLALMVTTAVGCIQTIQEQVESSKTTKDILYENKIII